MKITIYTAIIFLFLVCFISCKIKDDGMDGKGFVTITIPDKNDKITAEQFDSIFEYNRYIIPEISDSSMLGKINKVYLIGDTLFVMHGSQFITSYDSNGKYIRNYSHIGQGPGEYPVLNDMDIKEGFIYILSGNKIYKYTTDDRFMGTINLENASKGLSVIPSGIALNNGFAYANESTKDNYSYSFKGKEQNFNQIPFNPIMTGLSYSFNGQTGKFFESKDGVFTFFPYNDTIYQLDMDKGKLKPLLDIKIGTSKRNITHYATQEEIASIQNSTAPDIINAPYMWDDKLLFGYVSDRPKIALISLEGKVIANGFLGLDSKKLPITFIDLHDNPDNKEVLSIIPSDFVQAIASNADNFRDSPLLRELSEKISEESNPVFVFYKIKI